MSNRRGLMEEQTVRVGALLKASEMLTKSGIHAVTLISHPTEGIIISGEEEMSKVAREMVESSSMGKVVSEAPTRARGVVNHFSTRAEKEKVLKQLFKCPLPPLPMPFTEMKTFALMLGQFGKVWEVEMHGTKFKVQ